jgi:hypothetical protein
MSNISSVTTKAPTPAPTKATNAPVKSTRNDGDADDGGAKASAASQTNPAPAPKPVTNTMGQLIGKTIDVQA